MRIYLNKRIWATVRMESGEANYSIGFIEGTYVRLFDNTLKLVENLTENDRLLGVSCNPLSIINLYKTEDEMYRITQNNGESYIVSGDHMLTLKFTNVEGIFWDKKQERQRARYIQDMRIQEKSFTSITHPATEDTKQFAYDAAEDFLAKKRTEPGYNCRGDVIKIRVDEYFELPKNMKRILYGFKHEIEFPTREISFDPYMLGLWLGDGTSSKSEITNIDKEILDYLYNYAEKNGLYITISKEMSYTFAGKIFRVNCFRKALHKYNLFDNKHIPNDYLYNTRDVRLQVLAGLIDSDGYLYHNYYEISQKSDRVAFDIKTLAESLGFRVAYKKVNKTCVKPNGERVTGLYNMVTISGRHVIDIPTLLPRKQAKPCGKINDFLVSMINVETVGISKCVKFETSELFFGQDYTVY